MKKKVPGDDNLKYISYKPLKISERFLEWSRGYLSLFLMYLSFGVAVYFMLMSQNLINSMDGIWHTSSFYAWGWEFSIGRWFWPFLDKLRFGVVSASLNTIVTLILISFGNILIVDLFNVKSKITAFIAGALMICTPVVCDSLTYCYMSVTFGMAFFLSVLAAYSTLRIQRNAVAVVTGGVVLSCAMGNYQAYLGVTCIILLMFFLKQLCFIEDKVSVRNTALKSICTIGFGGILYKCIVSLICMYLNINMSSYKGAGSVSVKSIIMNLPERLVVAYKDFYNFFFSGNIQVQLFNLNWIYIIAFLIIGIIIMYKLSAVFREKALYGILAIAAIIFIPVACNATLLLISVETIILMTGGMTVLIPLCLCLSDSIADKKRLKTAFCICLCFMIWTGTCIVTNDQISIKDGRNSVVTISENIVSDLAEFDYFNSDKKVAIVGKPSANSMFTSTISWWQSNDYAQFGGNFWSISHEDHGNNRRSWVGVFYEYCGVNLDFCTDEEYGELISTDTVKNMPCYPAEGAILENDGIIIIKVSDVY